MATAPVACAVCHRQYGSHKITFIAINRMKVGCVLMSHQDEDKGVALNMIVPTNSGFLGGALRIDNTATNAVARSSLSQATHRYQHATDVGLRAPWSCCAMQGDMYQHEVTRVSYGTRMSVCVGLVDCRHEPSHGMVSSNILKGKRHRPLSA